MWTDVTLGRNGRERQRNMATCAQQTDYECERVGRLSFGGKEGRKVSEEEEGWERKARKRDSLILERAQRHIPQFSDSKSWLTVSEVEPVRQLATRIWSESRSPHHLSLDWYFGTFQAIHRKAGATVMQQFAAAAVRHEQIIHGGGYVSFF